MNITILLLNREERHHILLMTLMLISWKAFITKIKAVRKTVMGDNGGCEGAHWQTCVNHF